MMENVNINLMEKIESKNRRYRLIFISLIGILLFGIVLSLSVGDVSIKFRDVLNIIHSNITGSGSKSLNDKIVMNLRLPRTIFAIVVGIGLGICGTVMQASVQNPLADPYILGISSGSSLGATFYILLFSGLFGNFSKLGIPVFAFFGGIIASVLVILLSSVGGKMSSTRLILSGTVVNAICTAFSNFIIYLGSNSEGIKSITFWTMGSLAIVDFKSIILPGLVVALGVFFFLSQTRNLNNMMIGEESSITLGIDLNKYRKIYIGVSVMITGVLVASAGIIGFVGLVMPHIMRGLVGSNNKKLLPLTIISSGTFLLYADILSRVLIKNAEIPIGIITSMVGAPIFMYILINRNRKYGGR